MNIATITKNILLNIKEEIKKEENITIIKKDIIKPLIDYTIQGIYPYVIKIIIIIISIVFFMIIIIFLNIKIMYN